MERFDNFSNDGGTPFWVLNIPITELTRLRDAKQPVIKSHVNDFIRHATETFTGSNCLLVLPVDGGYVNRADFLVRRFECSQLVQHVSSFVGALEHVDGVPYPTEDISPQNVRSAVNQSVGALVVVPDTNLTIFHEELRSRLAFPWLLPRPIARQRIAWVQGREDIDCIERALQAAVALGIDLVILDEPGHWLEDPLSPWAHLREEFVSLDITPDPDLWKRIANTVKSITKPIHGIVTISDVRLAAVARACVALGLPTEDPVAYDIAADKGRTRMLEETDSGESFVLRHNDELASFLAKRGGPSLSFPRVVKPVVGWCSDCVAKVANEAELAVAVEKASARHASSPTPSTAVVVEPYADGPEVDANFALLDGEVVFCDINDDFPSPADFPGADFRANFQETQNVLPSGLPERELETIKETIRQTLLRQGFRSGVFHCEARVRNSAVQYARRDGIIDLADKEVVPAQKPKVYIHEVNARPPGYLESVAVQLVFGVDYYALRMLLGIGPSENDRFRALCQPFGNGPQFHMSVMIIQQKQKGIMRSQDAAREFLEKHPELKQHVVDYYSRKKAGDVLEGPDASALWWVAFLSVVSKGSRTELLQRVDFVDRNFDYKYDPVD